MMAPGWNSAARIAIIKPMYKDNSLIPTEAVRLAALGLLTERPRSYAELADEVRHFTSRIVGPSLDLIGPPIEVLRVEGLIETAGGVTASEATLRITEAGRQELVRLLGANLRGPLGEFNKLVIGLKLRFLELLEPDARRLQAELLAEICERELTRLTDLRRHQDGRCQHLADWLDHDIGQLRDRLAWFRDLQTRL
jgi:DNA-binding PadR family transcriptional regulator